jgi:hypothetical protein
MHAISRRSCTLPKYTNNQSSGSSISSESGSGFRYLSKRYRFDQKIAIYLCLSYRRSLQPSKENIQHFKKLNLFTFSMFLGNICPPGSGSGLQILIRIQIQGATDPIESGSNPDPQHQVPVMIQLSRKSCTIFNMCQVLS